LIVLKNAKHGTHRKIIRERTLKSRGGVRRQEEVVGHAIQKKKECIIRIRKMVLVTAARVIFLTSKPKRELY
jgi:uncharacterized protein YjcR